MAERVQKILSQWGIASRRKAEQMILAGRVQVNGRVTTLGDKLDIAKDSLEVDGKIIKAAHRPQLVYLLLNKPPGVVSTCSDPQNRTTVLDFLPQSLQQGEGIHPVGRLDFASSGALILTNDGELTLSLTHPRYHLPKTYLVELDKPPSKKDLALWAKGIMLDDRKTLPAKIKQIDNQANKIEIVLTEGRNRQIRRVAEQLGYRVRQLHRLAIASINLKFSGNVELPPGKYKHLKQADVDFLKKPLNLKPLNSKSLNLKPLNLESSNKAAQPRRAVYDKEQS